MNYEVKKKLTDKYLFKPKRILNSQKLIRNQDGFWQK